MSNEKGVQTAFRFAPFFFRADINMLLPYSFVALKYNGSELMLLTAGGPNNVPILNKVTL